MSFSWLTALSLVWPSCPSCTWLDDWPAHCELHTPLVCEISGWLVMNRLGSRLASAPTHGVSKCLAVFNAPWILEVSVCRTWAPPVTVISEPTAPTSKVILIRRTCCLPPARGREAEDAGDDDVLEDEDGEDEVGLSSSARRRKSISPLTVTALDET